MPQNVIFKKCALQGAFKNAVMTAKNEKKMSRRDVFMYAIILVEPNFIRFKEKFFLHNIYVIFLAAKSDQKAAPDEATTSCKLYAQGGLKTTELKR